MNVVPHNQFIFHFECSKRGEGLVENGHYSTEKESCRFSILVALRVVYFNFHSFSFFDPVPSACANYSLPLHHFTLITQNKAIEVFTRTILERAVASKSKDPIIAACVYLACRMEKYPRTLDEVHFATGVDVKEISKVQRVIVQKLELKIHRLLPEHLVNRFATRVSSAHRVSVLAQVICQNLSKHHQLESVAPQVVAAGTLVAAALLEGQALDVGLLTNVALVSVAAVKGIHRDLHPMLAMMAEGFSTSPAEHARLVARARALPAALSNLIKDGQLVVTAKEAVSSTSPPPSVPSAPAAKGVVDALVTLIEDLTAPVVTPTTSSVSSNNLTALLQSQRENMPSSPPTPENSASLASASAPLSPKPAARKLSIADSTCEVGIKQELAVVTEVTTTKRLSSFSYDEHSNDLEMLEPDRKVRKLASAKG